MKEIVISLLFASVLCACQSSQETTETTDAVAVSAGQEAVVDDVSQKDVVKVAVGSADHTTLVAAVKAADLVTSLSNAGPFTVFAPTNAAFDKLPKGTVEDLLKTENKSKLETILQHHVMTSALAADFFQDGQTMGMVDGTNVTFTVKDDGTYIDGNKILGSVKASNGWVHVIDTVLLPK
ncbi:fasciclin domain-containing protein [Lacihabitans sp. LS3-19]|uniref:fasciclin domain-containing protein n=1 Tax=Lacihabitans sp. LS3-19 TaxID=2487335 RepID=UPI0020CE9D19|nr:fasciclin domain-containing protein [Lacihabitans sp. LS3-19]MCP9770654.1 fasciclin domain-containing protein [Lacihabitans sp. LS3-19]